MQLIKSKNYWDCILAAAAMVLDEDVETLIKIIGHDGSQIINPDLKSPGNREGFHSQHIIDAALTLGCAMTPIEAVPIQTATGQDEYEVKFRDFNSNAERFAAYLYKTKGILIGKAPSGYYHAVAWDGEKIYDPRGKVYDMKDSKINWELYWLFTKIKN